MSDQNKRDSLYASFKTEIDKFVFDDSVADVFDDMLHRSIPGYEAIIAMIGVLAERYAKPGTQCYDLGSSLGAVTLEMEKNLKDRHCKIIAVDNSAAMVQRLQKIITDNGRLESVEVRLEDIRDTLVSNASVVVMNFTLQFIPLDERARIIQTIYDGLLPGSIFVLSEKIAFPDNSENGFQIDMHHEFKKLHGYSDLEISQKRTALENVLIPDTRKTHLERLKHAGFEQVYVWFQCFNFISVVAIK
ncbi:MAG: carboxy-S-adenosyl-L-methionine synthase CmoA [Gammaproteobacteria bacterium]|nr:carboxy-S-adenosyl-L-methionine synthase CmoA [Gammaproteobacteria bacterium]